jgi:hypothetical protein
VSRIVALLVKELAEHALVLLFVVMLCAGGFLLFLLAALGAPTTMTYLEAHANFARFALPFVALALGHRLVVLEQTGRTQKFLEALPMRPWEPLVVKWCFGTAVLTGFCVASLLTAAVVAAYREPIDLPFLWLVLVRSEVALLTFWSFFFAMGLLGKARVPIYLLLSLALIVIASSTSLELMRFGPFMLLGQDFVLERAVWPRQPLGESLAIALASLLLGNVVLRLREGSVEERLSKPMSQRELAFAAIASFALLTLWGELQDEPEPAPYVMSDDHVARSSTLPIAVAYFEDDAEPAAQQLLARLEDDVGALAAAAGWNELPQLRVALRRSLAADEVERVGLARDDGVLLRASFTRDDSDFALISAELIGAMLDARTRGRAALETRLWVRDGLAAYWASRNDPDTRRRLRAHALFVTRDRGPDAPRIRAFLRVREHEGLRGAAALAATGIETLVGEREPASVLGPLAARLFAAGATDDVRVVFAEWLSPVPHVLAEATSVGPELLTGAWRSHLGALAADRSITGLLGEAASTRAEVSFEASGVPDLVVRAVIPAGTSLTVRHDGVGPFDAPVDEHRLAAESAAAAGTTEIRLSGRYASHTRVLVLVDLSGTRVGAPLRLAGERLEVP